MEVFKAKQGIDIFELPMPPEPHSQIFEGCPRTNTLIVAPTASGKSNMICNLVTRACYGYRAQFQRIILISPTARTDRLWDCILSQPGCTVEVVNSYDEDFISNLLDAQDAAIELAKHPPKLNSNSSLHTRCAGLTTPITCYDDFIKQSEDAHAARHLPRKLLKPVKPPNILLILDDDVDALPRGQSTPTLDRLFMRGRHSQVTTWLSIQSYRRTPRNLRINAQTVILFAITDAELRVVADELAAESPRVFRDIFKRATAEKYSFLTINTRAPYN
jgi:hypothetical protein